MKTFLSSVILAAAAFTTGTNPAGAIEFRLLNWEGAESQLKFANKTKTVAVSASENEFSEPYQYTGDGPLVLFKEIKLEDKVVREVAATVPVPPGMTHGLLILAANDASGKTYAGTWIDDAPSSRPAETIRFLNLSNYQTALKFDGQEFTLQPGGSRQQKFDPVVQRIVLQGAANVGNNWILIAGNPVPVRSGLRLLVIMRDGRPAIGRATSVVDLVSFYDRPPAVVSPGTKVANSSR